MKLTFFVWEVVVVRGQPPNPRGFLGMTRVFDICFGMEFELCLLLLSETDSGSGEVQLLEG